MARATYENVITHCVICTKPVPADRLKYKAITCTEECAAARKNSIRAKQDMRECRYCRKPSTFEERAAFARFRTLERKRPDMLYPEAFEIWKADLTSQGQTETAITKEKFAEYWTQTKSKAA